MLWRPTFIAWSAVEEDDPWELFVVLGLVGVCFMFARATGEDLDRAGFWFGVVFGHVEEVFSNL